MRPWTIQSMKWLKLRFALRAAMALGPVCTTTYFCSKMTVTCFGSARCCLTRGFMSKRKQAMLVVSKCPVRPSRIGLIGKVP